MPEQTSTIISKVWGMSGPLHCNSMEAAIMLKKGDLVMMRADLGIDGELCVVGEPEPEDLSKMNVTKLY